MSTNRFEGRGRLDDGPPMAVIDIGSNSVRLVVYEAATRSPAPLFNEKALCGLGRSVSASGRLEGEGVAQTFQALRRFRLIIDQLAAGKPWILATAAVREAQNGEEFIAEVERICGAKVMLLSGRREAEMAAAGVVSGFYKPTGIAADLGGGSLEIMNIGDASADSAATTLPLGGLRLQQRSGGDLAKAAKLIDQDLKSVPWLPTGAGLSFFAIGGTWRNIARLHMLSSSYPLHITHGYSLSADEIIHFCDRLVRGKRLTGIPGIEEVSSARREVIPLGALALKRLTQIAQPKEVVFSVHGIREGLLYSLLAERERQRDPLIASCEDYAVLRSRSPIHARELCDWTDQLFVAPGPLETPEERRLRHAACLISDISWRAHPDYRGEQSLNVIANASFSGLMHPERVFLALTVYFRHTGGIRNDFSEQLMRLISKTDQRRARLIGAAIRAAHMLSVGTPRVITRTPIRYDGDSLVLALPPDLAELDGERLRKRLDALARLLERTPRVEVTEPVAA